MLSGCAGGERPPSRDDLGAAEPKAMALPEAYRLPASAVRLDYFPTSLREPSLRCDEGGRLLPVVDDFQARRWSRLLAAAGEAPLAPEAGTARPAGSATIRFLWLRSFHPPVIVRIETAPDGGQHVVAKLFSGSGGYDPGEVEARIERPLSGDEMRALRILLERRRPFDLPPGACGLGMDGARWIFERVDDDGYRFLERWTPRAGPAHALGRFLMGLTGWELDPVY